MIEIKSLKQTDIGKWVEYRGTGGEHELGRIKSWNDTYIFVVYHYDNNWMRFRQYTGASTRPEDLFYADKLCNHCKTPIAIRNAKGICDHLYYPENCEVCKNG